MGRDVNIQDEYMDGTCESLHD